MQSKIIYTMPFVFPHFPQISPSLSQLQRGSDGLFGFAIEPIIDYNTQETMCIFFEVDMHSGHILQRNMILPYAHILQMRIVYNQIKNTWVIALNALAVMTPLDVYELPHETNTPWLQLFAANSLDPEDQSEKSLIAFWQHGQYSPLLFCKLDPAQMYDSDLYWTQWRPETPVKRAFSQKLGSNYARSAYICEEGCLLFSCQCVYDEEPSYDPISIYRKRGMGHWQLSVAAYESSSTLRGQYTLPRVSYPLRDLNLAKNDLIDWLMVCMCTTDGPLYGFEKRQTCVAALLLQDRPGYLGIIRKSLSQEDVERELQESKGGLYWFDMHGRILQHDPTLHGEQVSLCLCGDQVMGTHVQDGQRFLWSWSPSIQSEREIGGYLPSEVQRATVIAVDERMEEYPSWFWCVEEYTSAIRVVQYECDGLHERQAIWCEGIILPDKRVGPHLKDWEPQGIVAYQDRLLILGMDLEKQLQLFQIQ